MSYKVFVTAAPKDVDLVRDLAQRLKGVGIEVHSDFEVGKPSKPSSDKTRKALKSALNSADEIFVILTSESMDNPNLMFFLGLASSWLKRITPVVVGLEASEIPPLIKSLKYVQYPNISRYIADLGKRAKAA